MHEEVDWKLQLQVVKVALDVHAKEEVSPEKPATKE